MITIDGKEFTKEQMSKEQTDIFTKINELDQKKKLYQFELDNLDILIQHYITKFNDSDPRNNMVEPKLVIDEYKKLDKTKPVACATK